MNFTARIVGRGLVALSMIIVMAFMYALATGVAKGLAFLIGLAMVLAYLVPTKNVGRIPSKQHHLPR